MYKVEIIIKLSNLHIKISLFVSQVVSLVREEIELQEKIIDKLG